MLLEVKDLSVEYDVPEGNVQAVTGVSFDVEKGETFGLAGESGCGKTTIGRAIMRILPPEGLITGGSVSLDGTDLATLSDKEMRKVRWKDISMVFQGAMDALNPTLNVGTQISEALLIHNDSISKKEALGRVREMLNLVGMDPSLVNSYPHELSGGMKQRACIAMALILHPKLIIADETTTALDVMIQAQILRLLRNLQSELGLSMLIISHDLGVLAENCSRLGIMYAGILVEMGTTAHIFDNPRHPYTKGLLRAAPEITDRDRIVSVLEGSPPSLLDPPRGCRFFTRCKISEEKCETEIPPLLKKDDSTEDGIHAVACFNEGSEE